MKLIIKTDSKYPSMFQRAFKSKSARAFIWLSIAALLFNGCATIPEGQLVSSTPIKQAETEIPEEQLLDVGVTVFDSDEIDSEDADFQGTTEETRKAETNFMASHMKNTLQQSSQWGAVRVVPDEKASVDVLVKGKILHSNGEDLVIAMEVRDASGRVWFNKRYRAHANEKAYNNTSKGERDVFQDIYNAVANDMALYKTRLKGKSIETIRNVSLLKFAEAYAPDAFQGYLGADKKNRLSIKRIPADDDPMLARLKKIREREFMYVDTLNGLFDDYYNTMWPSYENWRKLNLVERVAIDEVRDQTATRILIGALLIAGAIILGANIDNGSTSGLETGLVIVGGQVIMDGVNISRNAEFHEEAIKELSESFGSEMKPVVMDFEGQQYELTGSAQEQFKQWRDLMRQIYQAETGFDTLDSTTVHPVDN